MRKHTPGPWHTDGLTTVQGPRPEYEICVCLTDADDVITAEMAIANAALIAAAPDLLEALKELLGGVPSDWREVSGQYRGLPVPSCVTDAYAAIAKAEGR